MLNKHKIVIITSGQPSTNPRMVKEYTALKKDGYQVKVFYSFWSKWAVYTDEILFKDLYIDRKDFTLIGGSPFKKKLVYFFSRILFRISHSTNLFSYFLHDFFLSRTTFFLIKSALKEKADLYIAHNLGALPAAVYAAKKFKAEVGFDAEDFHRGEFPNQAGEESKLVKEIEDEFIPECDFLTAASPLIAERYKTLYPSKNVVVINNVFSKKYLQQRTNIKNEKALSLFWFSQTVGPNRGLETVVEAIELLKAECAIELHLLGNISKGYTFELLSLTTTNSIHFIEPVSPEEVFKVAAQFDVGLSVEVPYCENRDICLTNKLFTYLLAGNCIIFSNTKAQQAFLNAYPKIGYIYDFNNTQQLANILRQIHNDRDKLQFSKINASRIAGEIYNWENETKKFLQLIKTI